MVGHFTSLSASGPGPVLWYTPDGTWSSELSARKVFQSTPQAQHTGIFGLPAGYHPKVVFVTVVVENQPPPPNFRSGCGC
jgi:hypothetical protein